MNDISTPEDIHLLVHTFYGSIRQDALLGPVFDGTAHVKWEEHLPVMEIFWGSLLLKSEKYRGNALQPHLQLFQKLPFRPALMTQWLFLFDQTIDSLFMGEVASKAKQWAKGIAHNLQKQIAIKDSSTQSASQ